MIETLLKTTGNRLAVSNVYDTHDIPLTIGGARLAMSKDLTFIIDFVRGQKMLLEADTSDLRALGPHPDLGNTLPLSAVYLAALVLKNPFLPDSILVDPSKAPKAFIMGAVKGNIRMTSQDIHWIFPDGGIESTVSGKYYIPCFPDYLINASGVITRVTGGGIEAPDVGNSKQITLNDGDGNSRTVYIKHLMVMAFGKYDKTMSDEVFFLDGNEENFSITNIISEVTDNTSYSVTLTDSDENNIENY